MISTFIAVVIWTLVAQSGATTPAKPAGDLAAAKALYASGDYEEALNNLSAIKADDSVDEVEEYRSLCLLALGRTAEAQRSLERLVTRNPLFKMSEADVSPRLIAIFHDVRRRILPGTVRDLYAKAKANFEQGKYDVAKPQFEDLMTLLADDDLAEDAASLSDLKMLSDGFLKLATAQLAAKAEAAKATPPPAPKAGRDRRAAGDVDGEPDVRRGRQGSHAARRREVSDARVASGLRRRRCGTFAACFVS